MNLTREQVREKLKEIWDIERLGRDIKKAFKNGTCYYDEFDNVEISYLDTVCSGVAGLKEQVSRFYHYTLLLEDIQLGENLSIEDFLLDKDMIGEELTHLLHEENAIPEDWWVEFTFNDSDSDLDFMVVRKPEIE